MYLNPPFGSEILSPQKNPPKADHGRTSKFHTLFSGESTNISPNRPVLGQFFWVDTYTYLGTNRWERWCHSQSCWHLVTSALDSKAWLGWVIRWIHRFTRNLQKKNVCVKLHTQCIYVYICMYINTVHMYIYISFPMFAVKMTETFEDDIASLFYPRNMSVSTFILSIIPGVLGGHYIHGGKKLAKKTKKKHLAPENGCRAPKRKLYRNIPTIHFQVQTCC